MAAAVVTSKQRKISGLILYSEIGHSFTRWPMPQLLGQEFAAQQCGGHALPCIRIDRWFFQLRARQAAKGTIDRPPNEVTRIAPVLQAAPCARSPIHRVFVAPLTNQYQVRTKAIVMRKSIAPVLEATAGASRPISPMVVHAHTRGSCADLGLMMCGHTAFAHAAGETTRKLHKF